MAEFFFRVFLLGFFAFSPRERKKGLYLLRRSSYSKGDNDKSSSLSRSLSLSKYRYNLPYSHVILNLLCPGSCRNC